MKKQFKQFYHRMITLVSLTLLTSCFPQFPVDLYTDGKQKIEDTVMGIEDLGDDGCITNTNRSNDGDYSRPVTFIGIGDTQFGDEIGGRDRQKMQVSALNFLPETPFDSSRTENGTELELSPIRGLIMAGDITHNGRDGRGFEQNEYGRFTDLFGLCGNKDLNYPIYEGYGNHDYYIWSNFLYGYSSTSRMHPVVDSVARRNPKRPGVIKTAKDRDGHYSFEWGQFHFVQLNLAPANEFYNNGIVGNLDPRDALVFLKEDLEENVRGTNKHVIIISHYGYELNTGNSDLSDDWAGTDQWDEFASIIASFNIVALLHGHAHSTSNKRFEGFPVFNLGSSYYERYNVDQKGHFTVFHAENNQLIISDVSWTPTEVPVIEFPGNWCKIIQLDDKGSPDITSC
ncbi:hypothetical protein OAB57_02560 [Bacteriovoracaceae bacterium]|nr:hypothetical protein [Bacteriovoracaceae bacterium]